MPNPDRSWSVPVRLDDVPEDGLVVSLSADEAVREAIARRGGLTGLARLEARFEVTRRGSGLHVGGTVSATAGQICVVTLEPMESGIEEEVDLLFSPDAPKEEPGPPRDPGPFAALAALKEKGGAGGGSDGGG